MNKKKDYMIEIVDYIKRNIKKGYTVESLKWALVSQGYSKLEVEKAIVKVNADLAAQAPVLETKPTITYETVPPVEQVQEKKSFWKKLFG